MNRTLCVFLCFMSSIIAAPLLGRDEVMEWVTEHASQSVVSSIQPGVQFEEDELGTSLTSSFDG